MRSWSMPRAWSRWSQRNPSARYAAAKRWRALAQRRALQGLTTRGEIPKRRREHRLLLIDIERLANELQSAYPLLNADGKEIAKQLGATLARLRKKLI